MAFTVVQKLDKDPKDITPDYTLDTLGEPCPYPAIVMLETMPQLQKGEILELLRTVLNLSTTFLLIQKPRLHTIKRRTRWHQITLFNSTLM